MEWNVAIETNREALKRILASLVAMAGLRGQFTFFPQEGAQPSVAQAEKSKLSPALTLPRRLHSAVLRLLRPAEAAARRLVIVVARELTSTQVSTESAAPPPHRRKAKLSPIAPILRSLGIAVVLSPKDIVARVAADRLAAARAAKRRCVPARLAFPLFDPLRQPFRPRRRTVPPHAAPRILSFGDRRPDPLPPPPSPDDAIDATRLGLRLQALGRVLDDLPGQARRFSRWKARRDAILAQNRQAREAAAAQTTGDAGAPIKYRRIAPDAPIEKPPRTRRIWPLRPGRPPGCRLPRYDPSAIRLRNIREVDEILAHTHALAVYALEHPDTS